MVSAQPGAPPGNGAERVSIMARKVSKVSVSKVSGKVSKASKGTKVPAAAAPETTVAVALKLLSAPAPVFVPFIPHPKTNLIQIGARLAPEGQAIKVICHSIGLNFKGRHPVTFCTESGCTAFSIWLGFSQIERLRISTGGFYAFNGTVESHQKQDYGRGFLANCMHLYTIERLD